MTCAALLGFLLDWIFGDPQKLPHPICAVGKLVSLSEKLLRRIFPKTPRGLTAGGVFLCCRGVSWLLRRRGSEP